MKVQAKKEEGECETKAYDLKRSDEQQGNKMLFRLKIKKGLRPGYDYR